MFQKISQMILMRMWVDEGVDNDNGVGDGDESDNDSRKGIYNYNIQFPLNIMNLKVQISTLLQDYNEFFKEFNWLVYYNKRILMDVNDHVFR